MSSNLRQLERTRSRSFGGREEAKKLQHQLSHDKKLPTLAKKVMLLDLACSHSNPNLIAKEEKILRADSCEAQVSLARRLGLKASQQKGLVHSWHKLHGVKQQMSAQRLMQNVFDSLCATDPAMSKIFVTNACVQGMAGKEGSVCTKGDHAKLLVCLLNEIVTNLDKNGDKMVNKLKDIGARHSELKSYGFSNKFWDKFGQKLVESLVIQENVRRQLEAPKAWTIVVAALTDIFADGFNKKHHNSHKESY